MKIAKKKTLRPGDKRRGGGHCTCITVRPNLNRCHFCCVGRQRWTSTVAERRRPQRQYWQRQQRSPGTAFEERVDRGKVRQATAIVGNRARKTDGRPSKRHDEFDKGHRPRRRRRR